MLRLTNAVDDRSVFVADFCTLCSYSANGLARQEEKKKKDGEKSGRTKKEKRKEALLTRNGKARPQGGQKKNAEKKTDRPYMLALFS
jgi:hypothetical protein